MVHDACALDTMNKDQKTGVGGSRIGFNRLDTLSGSCLWPVGLGSLGTRNEH